MISNNSFKFFALGLLVITSIPANADEAGFISKIGSKALTTAKYTAGIALLGSIFRFCSRKPTNDAPRYSLDDLEEGKDVWNNMFYLLDDGLIGHAGTSSSAKVEGKNIVVKPGCPSKGVYGLIHTYAKPIENTLKFPITALTFIAAVTAGQDTWSKFVNGKLSLDEATEATA